MKEEFYIYNLPNGIRGIHRRVKSGAARCSLIIGAGSRDEFATEYGIAHFAEHGFFKGTTHRKAYQVNCRLENLGGELNAFTTKEDTTVHATVLRGDFTKAAELIADVVFNSTFPDKELDKEREVIYDEINTLEKSKVEITDLTIYHEKFLPLLLLAMALLLLEFLFNHVILKRIP
jgi:predicted Zn-dependent peptidase